jgi:hypothetical protein
MRLGLLLCKEYNPMKRTTVYCIVLALMLAAFLIMACEDGATPTNPDPPAYCSMDPKPLICP